MELRHCCKARDDEAKTYEAPDSVREKFENIEAALHVSSPSKLPIAFTY